MHALEVLLQLLLSQANPCLPTEKAGVSAKTDGQQHSPGGGAVQQGGDAMAGEEVGAEEGEGGEVGRTLSAGQAAEKLFRGEHSVNIICIM